ncbi:TolC family protein [Leptospira kobayashii]|uniref:TolC family protein n=1 Tax=Leptospira kobayashii TaxID=1917830 RepID=UPI000D593895|nr:TolC family protein [Leptospira kobayashii]
MKFYRSIFLIHIFLVFPPVFGVSLGELEKQFQERNLQLLSKQYDIESSRAQILQARLWQNPTFYMEQNAYNWKTGRYFDISPKGQTLVSFQQLIELGGKREKRIQAKSLLKGITEYELYDLTRALKYELRSSFFSLYYFREIMDFYKLNIRSISETISRMEKSFSQQDVTLSEIMRLKAILFQLENESVNLSAKIQEQEDSLKLLLNDETATSFPKLELNEAGLDGLDPFQLKIEDLQNWGERNRPDVQIAEIMIQYEKTNLSLAKAEAIPDVSLGILWDRQGSYIENYYALTASIPIPVNDRNQGNIKSAEQTVKTSELKKELVKNKLRKEIYAAWKKAYEKDTVYKSYAKNFIAEYRNLSDVMLKNYTKRYITIIEFADFFDAYRQSMDQFQNLRMERLQSFENLNFSIGFNLLELEKI